MEKNINILKILKILVIINSVIVILSVFVADINYYLTKPLLAGSVMLLCTLEYTLLDKLHKTTKEA